MFSEFVLLKRLAVEMFGRRDNNMSMPSFRNTEDADPPAFSRSGADARVEHRLGPYGCSGACNAHTYYRLGAARVVQLQQQLPRGL